MADKAEKTKVTAEVVGARGKHIYRSIGVK